MGIAVLFSAASATSAIGELGFVGIADGGDTPYVVELGFPYPVHLSHACEIASRFVGQPEIVFSGSAYSSDGAITGEWTVSNCNGKPIAENYNQFGSVMQ